MSNADGETNLCDGDKCKEQDITTNKPEDSIAQEDADMASSDDEDIADMASSDDEYDADMTSSDDEYDAEDKIYRRHPHPGVDLKVDELRSCLFDGNRDLVKQAIISLLAKIHVVNTAKVMENLSKKYEDYVRYYHGRANFEIQTKPDEFFEEVDAFVRCYREKYIMMRK